MHATASRRLHLLPQPALPTLFRFQQSDGLAATACVPDVLRLPKGKPLHFTARSHPQTHGKNGTSARAPAFAQPFPPAHTPVCPKTAFISANARLPLSGRRRQAPAAKHPSLRLDDCGLPAITTLFHPHRNIALTACRRVRRVSEPMDTSKTARRPPRSRLRRPFLPLGPPPQPGTTSAQRYRFPLLSGAAPFRRSSAVCPARRMPPRGRFRRLFAPPQNATKIPCGRMVSCTERRTQKKTARTRFSECTPSFGEKEEKRDENKSVRFPLSG